MKMKHLGYIYAVQYIWEFVFIQLEFEIFVNFWLHLFNKHINTISKNSVCPFLSLSVWFVLCC